MALVRHRFAPLLRSEAVTESGYAHARLCSEHRCIRPCVCSRSTLRRRAAGEVHQAGEPVFNSTASGVPLPSPFEADSVDVEVSATWHILYDTGAGDERCWTVAIEAQRTVCLQCAPRNANVLAVTCCIA